MTIDCDKYRLSFQHIEPMFKNKTTKEQLDAIGAVAVATGVPIIVVCCYYQELYGISEQLTQLIERLKRFYQVTEVLNVRN